MTRKMTAKERFEATLNRERVDRVPITDWDTYGIPAIFSGLRVKDVRWDPKTAVEATKRYLDATHMDLQIIGMEQHSYVKDLGEQMNEPDDHYGSAGSNFFKTPEDVESKEFPIDVMDSKQTPWMNRGIFDKISLGRQVLGDQIVHTGYIMGVFTIAGLLRGVETFMMDVLTEEDLAHKIIAKTEKLVTGMHERGIQAGGEYFSLCDPIASEDMISHEYFKKFDFEPTRRLISRIKSEYDVPVICHICGDTTNTCKYMPELGVDVFSMDSKVDLAYYKKELGDQCALEGAVPTIDVMLNGTPEMVMASAKECFEKAAKGGGFILAPACSAPFTTPIENLYALREAAEKFTPIYQ